MHIPGPPIIEYVLYFTLCLIVCASIFAAIVWLINNRAKFRRRNLSERDTIAEFIENEANQKIRAQLKILQDEIEEEEKMILQA